MKSYDVDDNHGVSILAVAAKDFSVGKSPYNTTKRTSADIVNNVQYETVASIWRQYACRDISRNHSNALNSNQERLAHKAFSSRKGEPLARMKKKFACRHCRNFCKWLDEHNDTGTLNPGLASHARAKMILSLLGKQSRMAKNKRLKSRKGKKLLGLYTVRAVETCLKRS